MVTRIVDNRGRVSIPPEISLCFGDGFAYFAYSIDKNEIYAATIGRLQEVIAQYGENSMSNSVSRLKIRPIGSEFISSEISDNGRVVIPELIRRSAQIDCGNILEVRVEYGKGFVLKKAS